MIGYVEMLWSDQGKSVHTGILTLFNESEEQEINRKTDKSTYLTLHVPASYCNHPGFRILPRQ